MMNTQAAIDNHLPHASRARLAAPPTLSLAWIALVGSLILYGSLLPLAVDLSVYTPRNGYGLFTLTWHRASLEDIITNLLVYLPLGVTIALARPQAAWRRTLCLAAVIGFAWSTLAESLQAGIALRCSSWLDVLLNTAGCFVGAALAFPLYHLAHRAIDLLHRRLREAPVTTASSVLAAGLLLASLSPFTFVHSTAQLHDAFRRAEGTLHLAWLTGGLEPLLITLNRVGWFALLGYLLTLSERPREIARRMPALQAWMAGCSLAILIEVMQLFTLAHVFSMTSLCLHGLGVSIGVWAGSAVRALRRAPELRRRIRRLPTGLLAVIGGMQVLVLAATLADGWAASSEAIGGGLGNVWTLHLGRLPFEGMWRGAMATAAADLFAHAAQFGLLAGVALIILRRVQLPDRPAQTLTVLIIASVALLIALADALINAGAFDVTQPIIATAAAWLTTLVWRRLIPPATADAAPTQA
jgi:VanZ family protein